jgi:hypothetical protein
MSLLSVVGRTRRPRLRERRVRSRRRAAASRCRSPRRRASPSHCGRRIDEARSVDARRTRAPRRSGQSPAVRAGTVPGRPRELARCAWGLSPRHVDSRHVQGQSLDVSAKHGRLESNQRPLPSQSSPTIPECSWITNHVVSHSPTLRPWIDWLVLRGGVLEPGALVFGRKRAS